MLAAPIIAKRAKKHINEKTPYNVLFNNCHRFTCGCVTGNFENDVVSFAMLEEILHRNIALLRPKKSLWHRFKNFVLRKKEKPLSDRYNWRPVKFD